MAGAVFTGCKEDDPVVPPTPETPQIEVVGAESGYAFAYYDGEDKAKTFTVYATAPWTVKKDAGWFVVEPSSGKAGEEIRVTLTAVENDGAAREGKVTVVANAGTYKHPVTAEYSFSVSQTAYRSAEFVVNGIEDGLIAFPARDNVPYEFTVENAYDWTLAAENETWYAVAPKSGKGGESVKVVVTPKDNDKGEINEGKLTFTAKDPENADNAGEAVVALTQEGYFTVDQHEAGFVFYNEDFSWMKDIWPAEGYSLHGYPTVDTGEFPDGVKVGTKGSNDCGADKLGDIVAEKFAGMDTAYGRYDGFIKIGKTANMGYILTHPLSAIDEGCTATLLCSFRVQGYRTANVDFNPDVQDGKTTIPVEIVGAGTFDDGETIREFGADVFFTWMQHEFVIVGATSDTQLKFGSSEEKKNRLFLDDIKVVRADDKTAEAAESKTAPDALAVEVSGMPETAMGIGGGTVTTLRIMANREWKLTSDSDWVTFTQFASNSTKDKSAGISYNETRTEASSNGSALPFNNNIVTVAANDGAPRSATLTLEVEGKTVGSYTLQQNGASDLPFITPSVKSVNFNAFQNTAFEVSVDANEDWTLAQDGDWFTVDNTVGKAGETVVVKVTPKIHSAGEFGARSGKLTLTGAAAAAEIVVEQAAADMTPTLAAGSDVYWSYTEADFTANTYNWAFEVDNLLGAANGTAYMQYIEVEGKVDPDSKFARVIGGTGHPYVTGAWPGDYWLFSVPTTALAAGTKINFTALSRVSGTGHLYWMLEYFNGTEWVPAAATLTAEVSGQTVEYTHALSKDSKNNTKIDETITLPVSLPAGFMLQVRFRCMANWTAGGAVLAAPNDGTMRFAGAGAADSPRIKIVE